MRKVFDIVILCGLLWFGPALNAADTGGATPRILVFGDSLSAAYGIETQAGWVALLEQRLRERGYPHQVINASISGETTAGGRARLPGLLAREPFDLVIIELGGNDGLRGLDLRQTEDNLRAMIDAAHASGAQALLVGMRLPPNYGPTYTEAFTRIYSDLASELEVALVPFLLEGVGTDAGLMQPDRVHPRAEAQARLLDNVWPTLVPLL
ncbi:MAG: arylesterase [Thiohalobacteraceae bacterium]